MQEDIRLQHMDLLQQPRRLLQRLPKQCCHVRASFLLLCCTVTKLSEILNPLTPRELPWSRVCHLLKAMTFASCDLDCGVL